MNNTLNNSGSGWLAQSLLVFVLCGSVFIYADAVAKEVPECNRIQQYIDGRVATAAGCFVKVSGKLLLVRQSFNRKLGFPGGFSAFGESAQCTAHRETWEETGLQVEVGKLAAQFGNGFLLYHCYLLLNQDHQEPLSVPTTGRNEIAQILWLDPHRVPYYEWRFSWQVPEVLRLFDQEPD